LYSDVPGGVLASALLNVRERLPSSSSSSSPSAVSSSQSPASSPRHPVLIISFCANTIAKFQQKRHSTTKVMTEDIIPNPPTKREERPLP
jgi:hypothetical protein